MPNLSRLIPPRVMPPHHAAVNRGHPLSQNMKFCYLCNGSAYSFIDAARLNSSPSSITYTGTVPTVGSGYGSGGGGVLQGLVSKHATAGRNTVEFGKPFMTATSGFTIDFWFYSSLTVGNVEQTIISVGQNASGTDGYGIRYIGSVGSGKLNLNCGGVGNADLTTTFSPVPSHVVVTRNAAGTWQTRINGSLAFDAGPTTTPNTPTTSSRLFDGGNADTYFRDGWIAYVRGWDRVLTDSQAMSLYQDPFQMFHGVTMPRRSFATTAGGGSTATLAWHVA